MKFTIGKLALIASAGLLGSNLSAQSIDNNLVAQAHAQFPPSYCKAGTTGRAVSIGGKCNDSNGCSLTFKGLVDSLSYLRASSGSYKIFNRAATLKADGEWAVDKGKTAYFFDEREGYLGSDKSNFEGNAYFTYTPTSVGSRDIWVMRWNVVQTPVNQQNLHWSGYTMNDYQSEFGELLELGYLGDQIADRIPEYPAEAQAMGAFAGDFICSKKTVTYQSAPEIKVVAGDSGVFDIHYLIDNANSKAIIEGTTPLIKITQDGDGDFHEINVPAFDTRGYRKHNTAARVERYRDASGNYWGIYKMIFDSGLFNMKKKVRATLYDGAHSKSVLFYGVHYKSPENNQTQGCTWSSTASYGNGMGGGSYYEYPPIGECQYRLKIVETNSSGVRKTTYR